MPEEPTPEQLRRRAERIKELLAGAQGRGQHAVAARCARALRATLRRLRLLERPKGGPPPA